VALAYGAAGHEPEPRLPAVVPTADLSVTMGLSVLVPVHLLFITHQDQGMARLGARTGFPPPIWYQQESGVCRHLGVIKSLQLICLSQRRCRTASGLATVCG